MKSQNYIIAFLLSVISVYLIIIVFVWSSIAFYTDHRVPNVRKIPIEYRASVISEFLENNYSEGSVLILGDSQPNGYKHVSESIYSSIIGKKINKNIINVAFQDARIRDNIYSLQYSIDNKFKYDAIIYNVNQSGVNDTFYQRLNTDNGVSYIDGILKKTKTFLQFVLSPNPTENPNQKLTFKKYGDTYFKMDEASIDIHMSELRRLIRLAKQVGREVFIYPTPHADDAAKFSEFSFEDLDNFSERVKAVVQEEGAKFFNPTISDSEYYMDIVHFNALGHKKMAEIIINKVFDAQ